MSTESFKYKLLFKKEELLEEIKCIFNYKDEKNNNLVPLSLVYKVLENKSDKYSNEISEYENRIDNKLRTKYSEEAYCVINEFDYDNNILQIDIKKYAWDEIFTIYFSKKEDNVYIFRTENYLYASDYLNLIKEEINELFDSLIIYKKYKKEAKYGIYPINSNFKVDVTPKGVRIKNYSKNNLFEINNYVYERNYKYNSNFKEIIEITEGYEEKLFENIFINISECPDWMQEDLISLREQQIKELEKLELKRIELEQQKVLEKMKQEEKIKKILSIKKKIFPWIK